MGKAAKSSNVSGSERPVVYRYHDYRAFLKDWFAYLKESQPGFSLRRLSASAKLASGYLPMVLAGSHELSLKALAKLLPCLQLARPEQNYFENLVKLCTCDTPEARIDALARMEKYAGYKKSNPNESHFFEYMSHWVCIAIREMATLPDFELDSAWIQKRLKPHVSVAEIEEALSFLIQRNYICLKPDGKAVSPEGHLQCVGGVYRTVLAHYHKEMMALAAQSIETTSAKQRNLFGHTFSIDSKLFDDAKRILDDAVAKLRALSDRGAADSIYHVELALFPLTNVPKEEGSGS